MVVFSKVFVHSFASSLLHDAVSNYIASNDCMVVNNKLEMTWNQTECPDLSYYPSISLEELSKTMKPSVGPRFEQKPPEYESDALPLEPNFLVLPLL